MFHLTNSRKILAFAIISLLALLATFQQCIYPIELGLDPGWTWCINKGGEFFFTSGPLGYVVHAVLPSTWMSAYYFNVAYLLFTWLLLCALFKRTENEPCAVALLLLLTLSIVPLYEWRFFTIAPILSLIIATEKDARLLFVESLIMAGALHVMSLVKFTLAIAYGMQAIFLLAFLTLRNRKSATIFAIVFGIGVVSFIPLIDKNFLRHSLEISLGYPDAMTTHGDVRLFWFVAIVGFAASCLIFIKELPAMLIGTPFIVFAYKYTMVRTCPAKIALIAYALCFMSAGVIFINRKIKLWQIGYFTVALFIGIAASFAEWKISRGTHPAIACMPKNILSVFRPNLACIEARNKTIHNLNSTETFKIPIEWTKLIGQSTVTPFPVDITAAVRDNLNVIPYAIVQGYSAYTAKLDALGAEQIRTGKAGEFLLLDEEAIDGRNVFLDTPATWQAINDTYDILKEVKGRRLAKRAPVLRTTTFTQIGVTNIASNTWFDMPENCSHMTIEWKKTFVGAIAALCYRSSKCEIEYEDIGNTIHKARIIPSVLTHPFPVMSWKRCRFKAPPWSQNPTVSLTLLKATPENTQQP